MNYKDPYERPVNNIDDPIKAERRADDRAEEARLKAQAQAQTTTNDARKTLQDEGQGWQDKGTDKAKEAKLKAEAKGKEFSNDVKDWGDKAGDKLHEGFEKIKDVFGGDDRVE